MVAIFILQVVIASVHSIVNYCKTKNQVVQINLPAVQEAPFQMNNQAFNEDITTLKEFSVLSLIITAMVLLRALQPKTQILNQNVADILTLFVFCRRFLICLAFFFIALSFFVRNRSLRKFAWKFSRCRCDEL